MCIKAIKKRLFINRLQQASLPIIAEENCRTVKAGNHIIPHRIKIVAVVLIMYDLREEVVIKQLDRQIAAAIAVEDVEDKEEVEAAHTSNSWTSQNSSTKPSSPKKCLISNRNIRF